VEAKNKKWQELNRFVHYYSRFKNHENSYKVLLIFTMFGNTADLNMKHEIHYSLCLSVCLSVCLQDFSNSNWWIVMKFGEGIHVGSGNSSLHFENGFY